MPRGPLKFFLKLFHQVALVGEARKAVGYAQKPRFLDGLDPLYGEAGVYGKKGKERDVLRPELSPLEIVHVEDSDYPSLYRKRRGKKRPYPFFHEEPIHVGRLPYVLYVKRPVVVKDSARKPALSYLPPVGLLEGGTHPLGRDEHHVFLFFVKERDGTGGRIGEIRGILDYGVPRVVQAVDVLDPAPPFLEELPHYLGGKPSHKFRIGKHVHPQILGYAFGAGEVYDDVHLFVDKLPVIRVGRHVHLRRQREAGRRGIPVRCPRNLDRRVFSEQIQNCGAALAAPDNAYLEFLFFGSKRGRLRRRHDAHAYGGAYRGSPVRDVQFVEDIIYVILGRPFGLAED